ncbi:hypothetical protein J31TS4_21540 [Paenibacillus sp. J31TS4]|nr:hypothetical protein J31TS4_21540 [Paenibacillus sp. J31TS4]
MLAPQQKLIATPPIPYAGASSTPIRAGRPADQSCLAADWILTYSVHEVNGFRYGQKAGNTWAPAHKRGNDTYVQ